MDYRTLDPTTGRLIEQYPLATDSEIGSALEAAEAAFAGFRRRPFAERAAILNRAALLLEDWAGELAELMALEMGKPLEQGEAEAKKCAVACRYYVEQGERILAPRAVRTDAADSSVVHQPLGPILAIMPWNFPLWQVFRFAAPALAAGNVAILKHAPSTPRCAQAIEALLTEAGAPSGAFQSLRLSNQQTADVIAHRVIRGVTLTGSTAAGREVGASAGRALKPLVLELGGSDPFIVFGDSDLEKAAEVAVESRCLNAGQSCIAAKRFLVEESVADRFLERMVALMSAKRVGDPRAAGTEIGPLAREDLRGTLAGQVEAARAAGAEALCGGSVPEGDGFFYPPTVLTGLDPQSEPAQQELFGPVAAVYRFRDEQHALALANGTAYGLGASLWTSDPARIDRMVSRIDAGSVFVGGLVKSDPRLPFGGVKDSGLGRELAAEGLLEFVNVKTVWIG